MNHKIKYIVSVVTIFFMMGTTAMSEAGQGVPKAVRVYQMERGDALELTMPKKWRHNLQQPAKDQPLMIELRNSGKREIFYFAIMPVLSNRKQAKTAVEEGIKRTLERLSIQNKNSIVEEHVDIKEIRSETVSGYYYRVTEREPADGKFKYMIQGIVQAGKMGIAFNIFTTKGQKSIEEEALDVIRSAKYMEADQNDKQKE